MKKLMSSMRIAFRALTMNKLRSALTMLGIVIGVASVIATVAIGSGATQRIQDQIASICSNIIIVTPGSTTSSGMRMGAGNAVTLSQGSATGFVFDEETPAGVLGALQRAVALYADQASWRRVVEQAMTRDFSWAASARRYLRLYRELAGVARRAAA